MVLGLDDANLSAHLKSRREVEHLLASGGVPTTVLRAAIVIGNGGISWEITRQLVAHLPVMIVPKWATTRTQPIALADVVRYLVGVLEPEAAKGRVFEIGGPEVLTYAEMMRRVAQLHHHRPSPHACRTAADPPTVVAIGCPWSLMSTPQRPAISWIR